MSLFTRYWKLTVWRSQVCQLQSRGLAGWVLTGVLSKWKCASLILSPWLPCGLDRPKSLSFRKGLGRVSIAPTDQGGQNVSRQMLVRTPPRSKRRRRCSVRHECHRRRRCHPHPICRLGILHDHEGSLVGARQSVSLVWSLETPRIKIQMIWGPGFEDPQQRWSFAQRRFTDEMGTTHGSRHHHRHCNPLSLQLRRVSPGTVIMRSLQMAEDGVLTDQWPIVARQDKNPTSSSTWCDDDLLSIASPPPSGTRGCRILP